MNILLPTIVYEDHLTSFLDNLNRGNHADEVCLDFVQVKYYIPAAITAIIARCKSWNSQGKRVSLKNHKSCEAFQYLQRIDFFNTLGLDYEENFNRHASPNFVTIQEITRGSERTLPALIENLIQAIASIDQSNALHLLLQYSLGEIIMNCIQHSDGIGYVSAQYAQNRGLVRIGISDTGIGIRESFKRAQSPHFREEYTDADMLLLAIKPEISGKNHLRTPYGDHPNAGIGLSMTNALSRTSYGDFFLASGNATLRQEGRKSVDIKEFESGQASQGVICSLAFSRSQIYSYSEMMKDSKKLIGLIREQIQDDEDIFE